jgi:hypothetical protein
MRKHTIITLLIITIINGCNTEKASKSSFENLIAYKETGKFGGWPANYGIWSWEDEIVFGFNTGYLKKKEGHAIDPDKPRVMRFARSKDGGQTWTIEVPNFLDENGKEPKPTACPGGYDFKHPDFAMMLRYGRYFISTDRGKTWDGPFKIPEFEGRRNLARTDVIVNGKHDLYAFMASAKDDGKEGWPFVARTMDGGKSWKMISRIGPQPESGYAIMPTTVRLANGHFLSMIRRKGFEDKKAHYWIEAYESFDQCKTWTFLNKPTETLAGNPGHMIQLKDGRLVLTYGYRRPPYGIRAMISRDGKTWGEEIVLRDDGGNWDLGYPRTVQRSDGKLVTVYYFNEHRDTERYIGVTIWEAGE